MTMRDRAICSVYIAASLHDARYTRICVASLRYFYPAVRIKLLPGGPLQRGLSPGLYGGRRRCFVSACSTSHFRVGRTSISMCAPSLRVTAIFDFRKSTTMFGGNSNRQRSALNNVGHLATSKRQAPFS